jgi:hypothetical protein
MLNCKYSGSPSLLLATVYPEYDWLPWKFYKLPKNYWQDIKNKRKFVEWVGKQWEIKDMSDWYKKTYTVKEVLLPW